MTQTNTLKQDVRQINTAIQSIGTGLVAEDHDYVLLEPAGSSSPTTITYKKGGSGGTVVATLTLAYSGGELNSVTRS